MLGKVLFFSEKRDPPVKSVLTVALECSVKCWESECSLKTNLHFEWKLLGKRKK